MQSEVCAERGGGPGGFPPACPRRACVGVAGGTGPVVTLVALAGATLAPQTRSAPVDAARHNRRRPAERCCALNEGNGRRRARFRRPKKMKVQARKNRGLRVPKEPKKCPELCPLYVTNSQFSVHLGIRTLALADCGADSTLTKSLTQRLNHSAKWTRGSVSGSFSLYINTRREPFDTLERSQTVSRKLYCIRAARRL